MNVRCYEAVLEVATPRRRDDLIAMLLLAGENDGLLTAEAINRSLLFRPPDSAHGMRVMGFLAENGMLHPTHRNEGNEPPHRRGMELSPRAREALRRREVRLTERGNHLLYVTDDPLFKEPLVGIVPLDRSRNGAGQADVLGPPPELMPYRNGSRVALALQGNREVIIEEIAPGVREAHRFLDAHVEVRTDEYGPVVLARSELCEGWTRVPSPLDSEDVLDTVLGRAGEVEYDDEGMPTLLSPFDSLEPSERTSFEMSRSRLRELVIDGYGVFDHAELEGVPVAPMAEDDAVDWANWLVREGGDASEEARRRAAEMFSERFDAEMVLLLMDDPTE